MRVRIACNDPCPLVTSHLTEVPYQSTLRTKARLDASVNNFKMRDIYTKSIRIDKAVAAIQRGEFIHFNNAADHYKCSRSAVSRRMRGLTKSKKEANSFWHQCLTIEQEEVLIHRINLLTDRGMPPTSHIVRNLAEEIRGKLVGKNWVGQFVKRHSIRLKSLYLRNIDNLRAGAEYAPMFQLFFSVVSCFLLLFRTHTIENAANVCPVSLACNGYRKVQDYSRKHI
jgi:hypothetical protein